MEAEPHSILRGLKLPTAGRASAGGGASSGKSMVQDVTCSLGQLPTVMLLTSDRVVKAGHVAVQMVVQVAVAAAEMLLVLAVVQVSVVVEGDTIPSRQPRMADPWGGCFRLTLW
ncbi:hypothetical protein NDU88_002045 [Pleurodeles waltl]|uniref:Uncharacterized protein n=1 Tax=Pleurodeles waltl TaxID=8319 RepID=A0AAV7WP32_PLEWA|nr:hypothetical protein NDU88_002045 [Pleurodeles waltl]